MELSANVHTSTTPALVTVTVVIEPSVPSRCQVLGPVSFIYVHLHAIDAKRTAGLWTLPITVVVSVGVWMVRTYGIEVVVDTPLRTPIVHIKLHVSVQEVPRSFARDTTATIHRPASAIPVRSLPHP